MIYILGHSHAILPIHTISANPVVIDHHNFSHAVPDIRFEDLMCREEFRLPAPAKYFIVTSRSGIKAVPAVSANALKRAILSQNFMKLLQDFDTSRPSRVFCFINGNEHTSLSMIRHAIPYDFMRPKDMIPREEAPKQIIPISLVRTQIYNESASTYTMLEILRHHLPAATLYIMCPPPPVPSSEWILKFPVPEVFGDLSRTGITDASVRLKYYQEYVRLLKGFASEEGGRFVEAPEAAVTPEGFLHESYWHDTCHGNESYARLVAAQIKECCQ